MSERGWLTLRTSNRTASWIALTCGCGSLAAMSKKLVRRARVITALNLKGGVGKTHICWLIAGVCEERGLKCLVLDLDKQGNISTTLLRSGGSGAGTDQFFNPAIDPEVTGLIQKTTLTHVDLIPGNFLLERYNETDPSAWVSSGLQFSLVDPLAEVRPFYDYILLDCPADISLITYASLCASDFLLIPLEAAQWGALGTQHVLKTLGHVRKAHNDQLRLLGFVVSRYKRVRKYQTTYLRQLRERFGDDAFETVIPDLSPFEQSVNDRIPVTLHSPSSHASHIARRFFEELETRTKRFDGSRQPRRRKRIRKPVDSVA